MGWERIPAWSQTSFDLANEKVGDESFGFFTPKKNRLQK
jgi:hypothetical protein